MPDKSLWLPLTLGVLAAGGSLVRSQWEAWRGGAGGFRSIVKTVKITPRSGQSAPSAHEVLSVRQAKRCNGVGGGGAERPLMDAEDFSWWLLCIAKSRKRLTAWWVF